MHSIYPPVTRGPWLDVEPCFGDGCLSVFLDLSHSPVAAQAPLSGCTVTALARTPLREQVNRAIQMHEDLNVSSFPRRPNGHSLVGNVFFLRLLLRPLLDFCIFLLYDTLR